MTSTNNINFKYMESEKEIIDDSLRTKVECYSRVVGFLRPVSQWNDGKQSEFKMRKMLNINEEQKI